MGGRSADAGTGLATSSRRKRKILMTIAGLVLLGIAIFVVLYGLPGLAAGHDLTEITLHLPENEVEAGSTTVVVMQVENDAHPENRTHPQDVLIARNVAVNVTDSGPFDVTTRQQALGSLQPGEVRDVELGVTVPEDLEPGEYEMEVEVTYTHLTVEDEDITETEDSTETVTITVIEQPRFEISIDESTAQIGTDGSISVELENVGDVDAREVALTLESPSERLGFGSPSQHARSDTGVIDELEAGEETTLEFDVGIQSGAVNRSFEIGARVRYIDEDGIAGQSRNHSLELTPLAKQSFEIRDVESTLRPGEGGAVTATIENEGPLPIEDVVIVVGNTTFEPRSPSQSIGNLDPGEEYTFTFRGTIPREIDDVAQQVPLSIEYRTVGDADAVSQESMRVPIDERRDPVIIEPVSAEFAAGEDGFLELRVTNPQDDPIRDIHLRIVAEDPLESEFQSTVIPLLEPGEADVVAFDIEVDSDAPPTKFPAIVQIEYTDIDDENITARPATVPVTVTERDDDRPFEMLIFGAVLILVALAFLWLYRQ